MNRTNEVSAAPNLFGPSKPGYVEGTPGVVPPTIVGADAMNSFQEELVRVPELIGLAPDADDLGQVARAIKCMFASLQAHSIQQVNAAIGADVNDVAYRADTLTANAPLWVAVGENGGIRTTTIPSGAWTSRTPDAAYSGDFKAICYSASLALFVAVGETGEIQTSSDGTTWTHRSAAASYTGTFLRVVWSGSLFVAVGAAGEIQTSANGTSWTHRTAAASFAAEFRDVVWTGTAFVACGEDGTIQRSVGGTTWTDVGPGGATIDFSAMAYDADKAVLAAGGYNGSSAFIYHSTDDGSTWTASTMPTTTGIGITTMAYGNGVFVALAGSGLHLLVSGDGLTWHDGEQKVRVGTSSRRLQCIANRFVVVGFDSGGYYMHSPAVGFDLF